MNRPVTLQLTLREAEALACLLARHKRVWAVIARELRIEDTDLEERIVEAHRAGLAETAREKG